MGRVPVDNGNGAPSMDCRNSLPTPSPSPSLSVMVEEHSSILSFTFQHVGSREAQSSDFLQHEVFE